MFSDMFWRFRSCGRRGGENLIHLKLWILLDVVKQGPASLCQKQFARHADWPEFVASNVLKNVIVTLLLLEIGPKQFVENAFWCQAEIAARDWSQATL